MDASDGPLAPVPVLERVPLFPLPHGALLPGELLPLHVFEPRYRRMMEVVRAGDRMLAIATLVEGVDVEEPPVWEAVGLGRVLKDRTNADGTSDIVVHGLVRGEIVAELEDDEPFRSASVTLRPDGEVPAPLMFRLRRELLLALADRLAHRAFRFDVTAGFDAGALVDRIASSLQIGPDERVAMMQSTDVAERAARLLALLDARRHRQRLLELVPSLHAFGLSLQGDQGGGPA